MSLKTLNKTVPQLLVLPDFIQKGDKVLDPVTLSELEDKSPITFTFSADMLAGRGSKTFNDQQIYQSKYDRDMYVLYGTCFDNSGIIGAQTKDMTNTPKSYLLFLEKGMIMFKNLSTNNSDYKHRKLFYEDNQFYYFLEGGQNDYSNNMKIVRYNKDDFSTVTTDVKVGTSGACASTETVVLLSVVDGLIKLFVPKSTMAFDVADVNISSGSVVNLINVTNLDGSNKGLASCILTSKIYNDCIYTVSSNYNTATMTDSTAVIQKTDLTSKSYKRIRLERNSSTVNVSQPGPNNYYYFNQRNGIIFEKEDKENNKYMIILNRSLDGFSYGYLTVVDGNFDLDNGTTSVSELGVKQDLSNVNYFISCDDDYNNLWIGDGFSLKKLQWNTQEGKYDTLSEFNVGSYQNFQLDSSGKIWIRGDEDLIRILPSQGVMLETSFDRDIYQFAGEPIHTFVNVSLKNQNGEYATVDQYVYLTGNAVFTETGTNYKKVSFDGSDHVTVPVTITEGGSVDCFIQF